MCTSPNPPLTAPTFYGGRCQSGGVGFRTILTPTNAEYTKLTLRTGDSFYFFIINHLVKWLISYKKPLTRYICFVRKRWGEEKYLYSRAF
jgi:hypothetical protein